MYKSNIELNKKNSASTGSVTCYAGKYPWPQHKGTYYFVEVADCQTKVRLHMSQTDTKKDFIKKVTKLRNELSKFLDYLEK